MTIITPSNISKIKQHRYLRTTDLDSESDRLRNIAWNRESYNNIVKLMTAAMKNGSVEILILMRHRDFKSEITTNYSYTIGRLFI